MARLIIKTFVFMLAISTCLCVVATELHSPEFYDLVIFNWQHTATHLSSNINKQNSRHTKQQLRTAIKDYLATKSTSLGVSMPTLILSEIAVILAMWQDAKISLNDNKTMALELKNLKNEDRAILYRLKYSW